MDSLSIEIIVLDDAANAKFNNFERRAENTASNINRSGKKINFGGQLVSDLERAEQKAAQFAARFDSLGLGTFGKSSLVVGAAIGGTTLALSKFVDLSKQAIDISIESRKANRLLAASATEAGLAYGDLADKNKKFAELNAISNTSAASTTARIAQLARTAGRPQDIDKLSASFSDLGAARGIAPKDLETLIGTILSGQDEGLNRLGLPDPSKIYAAYAAQIGKTVEQLSQMEKTQAAVNAVVEKSEIFKGAAQARLNSLEGQTESLNARWENFTTTLANNFASSREVNQGLTALSDVIKKLSYDTDDLQSKLSKGFSPSKLAAETAESYKNFDRAKELAGFIAKGALFSPSLTYNAPKTAFDYFNDTENKLRQEELQQRFNAELLQIAQQKKAAEEQKKNLDEIIAKEKEREAVMKRQTELLDLFKNPRSTTFDIERELQKLKTGSIFGGDILNESEKKKAIDAGEQELAQRTARRYQMILQSETKNLNELRNGLAKIKSDPNLFFEQKESLSNSFEQKIALDIEKAKEKINQLEKTYLSTFDSLLSKTNANNPCVQVFSEADKSLKELKDNIKGLPKELQAVAIKIQQQFNLRKLLEAGIDNKLSVFDLKQDAQNFRNPFDGEKQKKDQNEFIARFLRNNPNYLYLNNKTELDDAERQKILKRFAPSSLLETPADRLNKNLDEKFNLLYKPGQTADQLALADKRFISATAGANPRDLTKDLREKAAFVREREAVRQERYQQDALQIYRDQREYQKQIAENTKRQNEIGAKGGTKALELTLKDETSSGNAQLQSAPTARDTSAAYFDPDFDSLNNRGTLTNRR